MMLYGSVLLLMVFTLRLLLKKDCRAMFSPFCGDW